MLAGFRSTATRPCLPIDSTWWNRPRAASIEAMTTPGRSPRNRSLERGIAILRAFRPGTELLGNGEIAERTGLPRASVSRLTQTLTAAGYLEHDARQRAYRLGAPVLSLGHALRSGSPVLRATVPLMTALARRLRINVGLAVRDSDEMVYLDSIRFNVKGAQRSVVSGHRVPIELTALGRAWLAVAPAKDSAALRLRWRVRWRSRWREEARCARRSRHCRAPRCPVEMRAGRQGRARASGCAASGPASSCSHGSLRWSIPPDGIARKARPRRRATASGKP